MSRILFCFAVAVALQAAWFAWKSIRRMVRIARGELSMVDLSLADIQASQGLDQNPAFGDPMMLAASGVALVTPFGQFCRRWLLYFPLAWLTNAILPATWLFALVPALILWFINRP